MPGYFTKRKKTGPWSGELVFQGSLVAPLPQRLFVFFAAALHSCERAGTLPKDLTEVPYVYDGVERVYRKGEEVLEKNGICLVVASGLDSWSLGIGRSEEEARAGWITLPADERSRRWLSAIRAFAEENEGRFGAVSSMYEGKTPPRVAVIDTEREGSLLVQFAGVLLVPGVEGYAEEMEDHFYCVLPKGVSLSQGVRNVTGLSERFLRANGLSRWSAAVRLSSFLEEADIICGQDVNMDIRAVRELLEAEELDLPACVTLDRMVDTTVMVQFIYDRKDAVNLKDAALLTGVMRPGEHFHDAATDAEVTGRIFAKLLPEYGERFAPFPDIPRRMTMGTKGQELLNGLPDLPKIQPARPAPLEPGAVKPGKDLPELKHCPVCGAEAVVKTAEGAGRMRFYVACPACGRTTFHGGGSEAARTRRAAVNEWNAMQVKKQRRGAGRARSPRG